MLPLLHVFFKVIHALELLYFAGHENDEAQPDAGNEKQHDGHADGGPFHEADVETGGLFQNLDGGGVGGAAGGSGHAAEKTAAAYAEQQGLGKIASANIAVVFLDDFQADGKEHDEHGNVGEHG